MDPIAVKSMESRIKELELKVAAISEAIALEYKYTPEKYTLVQPEKGDES
jgi:hypothetical protein